MEEARRGKWLVEHEHLTNEEAAQILGIEKSNLNKLMKRDSSLRCKTCRGFFKHIKKHHQWCGFSCWAAQQPDKSWVQLKEEYAYLVYN